MSQLRRPLRSPRLIAFSASCMVTLDTSSSMVLIVGSPMPRIGSTLQRGFSPKTRSHPGLRPRRRSPGLLVRACVIDEPARDAEHEGNGADDEQRKPNEDAEREEHHAEAEDRRRKARLRNVNRVLLAVLR